MLGGIMMIMATQDFTAPSVPTNLAATNITATTFTLSWTGSTDTGGSGLQRYIVYKNGNLLANVYNVTTYNAVVSNGSYNIWQVSAQDYSNNESELSTSLGVTMLDTEVPTEPTGIGYSFPSNTELYLYWNASTDNVAILRYRVYKDGSWIKNVTGTSYTFTGLTAGITSNWAVQAEDTSYNLSTYNNDTAITQPGGQ